MTHDIAEFERVSLDQYIRDTLLFESYDDVGTEALKESIKEEWLNIKLPVRATLGAAGYDFYLPHDVCLTEHPVTIYTGICCSIQPGWALFLMPRSGLGFKYGVRLSNSLGLIDEDYYHAANEGHIAAKIYAGDKPVSLQAGDRFMQGVFLPYGTASNGNLGGVRIGGTGSTGLG